MARCAPPGLSLYTLGVLVAVFSMSKSSSVVRVRQGQPAKLVCSLIGQERFASVTWLRQTGQSAPVSILTWSAMQNKTDVQHYNSFSSDHVTATINRKSNTSTLEIRGVNVSDSGLYYCGALPSASGHMVYYDTTYLNVTDGQTPDSPKSSSVVVREGERVQLSCSVSGTGKGYTSVTWLKQTGQSAPVSILTPTYNQGSSANGAPSFHNCYHMTATMTSSMSTLEIRSVRVSDSGLYFCGAKPGQHMIYYSAIYLNVTGTARVNDSGTAGKGVPDECGPDSPKTAGDGVFCSGVCVSVVLVLAVLSVLLNLVLLLIIILLKHRSGQTHITVPGDQMSSPPDQARESDSLNYAALNFKKKKQRRTNLQTDDVVYAATR